MLGVFGYYPADLAVGYIRIANQTQISYRSGEAGKRSILHVGIRTLQKLFKLDNKHINPRFVNSVIFRRKGMYLAAYAYHLSSLSRYLGAATCMEAAVGAKSGKHGIHPALSENLLGNPLYGKEILAVSVNGTD